MIQKDPDLEFLTHLQRMKSASVQELVDATGVTTTAVRQRLMKLQNHGFVKRELAKTNRGRPNHSYQLTKEGVRSLGDDHAAMAGLLWREVLKIDQPEVRERVMEGIKQSLVDRFGQQHVSEGTLLDRMQEMTQFLSSQGFDVEVAREQKSGDLLPIIQEHNCPYHELAQEDSTICELEQAVYSELLGTAVELSACQLDGHRCCEFHVEQISD